MYGNYNKYVIIESNRMAAGSLGSACMLFGHLPIA